jgi:hypothetical protein
LPYPPLGLGRIEGKIDTIEDAGERRHRQQMAATEALRREIAPIAFMSYVRDDDTYERGRLTQLRERLSGEVAVQCGEPFPIFQDREDIAWGQQWQERLDESLDSMTFLIPVVTPRFFRSEACRAEIERFLQREHKLGRADLILPLYYIDAPVLNDPAKRSGDRLAKVIHSRQCWDWRPLRFKPLTSEQVGETIAKMAAKIVSALERQATARPVPTSFGDQLIDRVGLAEGPTENRPLRRLADWYMDDRLPEDAFLAITSVVSGQGEGDARLAMRLRRLLDNPLITAAALLAAWEAALRRPLSEPLRSPLLPPRGENLEKPTLDD